MDPRYRFCPRCSAPLAEGEKFGRTRHYCRYCGFIHFVEPKVAVAGVVTTASDGHPPRILLVRRNANPRLGFWALPAGYMDADESPEEAVAREVAEEAGVTVRVLGLRGLAPMAGWQERRGVLLLYTAEALTETAQAGDDVSDARWFTREEVPWDELAFESTAQEVAAWVVGH